MSWDDSCSFLVRRGYVVDRLNVNPNGVDVSSLKQRWVHLSDLPLQRAERGDVTVLIGMDVRGAHGVLDSRKLANREESPEVILTPFGWIAVGPYKRAAEVS